MRGGIPLLPGMSSGRGMDSFTFTLKVLVASF
jgi:hypothetical protein